jgi:pimeloyl-ACP methyl ester carboxylesterase
MGATDYGQPMREPFGLEHLEMPVLGLYGELDFPAVRRLAVQRLEQIRDAGHPLSAQQVMPGAGHYHEERADALVDAVLAWLDRLSPPGGGSR